jgi:ribosome-binding protein aMBF1 (putative translation factor)
MLREDKIRKVGKERGWSQKHLAEIIGTSGPIVGRHERSELTPSVEVAKMLAESFKVTLVYLLCDTDSISDIKDMAMLQRVTDIEKPDQKDKTTIVYVIDSLLGDAKKNAYVSHS